MSEPPCSAIFDNIIDPDEDYESQFRYRSIISTFVTALKREDHILFSFPSTINNDHVAQFIEHIVCSIFPATISVLLKDGKATFLGIQDHSEDSDVSDMDSENYQTKKRLDKKKMKPNPVSPFLANVCIVEHFDKIDDTAPIIKVMRELAVTINDHSESVPQPFVLVALANENSQLPRNTLAAFSYHINIQELPKRKKNMPLYQKYANFMESFSTQVYIHRDITTYLSQLILNVDCKPLLTSFIEVKTKLLLSKAIDDCAMLHGRNFIVPDDVQMLFPSLVTHRFLLPGPTALKNCIEFIQKLIETIPVPV